MKINLNDMETAIDALKRQTYDMGLIINPIINKYNLKDKEKLELCQIGKFLYRINPDLRIAEKPEPPNPDFILQVDNKVIGLEHTRIIDETKSQKFFSISNLFNEAAREFTSSYPDKNICATFRLKNDNLYFGQSEKKELIKSIIHFVLDVLTGNYQSQPDFIEEIIIMNNSVVSFSFLENNFSGSKLTISDLRKAISIKETKLQKYYRQSNEINNFWLVLMIGSLNSASFELDEHTDYATESIFDKVFLMSDFREGIAQIK